MSSENSGKAVESCSGEGDSVQENNSLHKTEDKLFTKPESRKPGKVNVPNRKKLKRLLSRQSSRSSKHSLSHKTAGKRKYSKKRARPCNKFFTTGYRRVKELGMIIPPTKFLLGGNICDPLNLNSLQDEEINRAMNAVTPKSSPLPTPRHRRGQIEVIIPKNRKDPLNLISGEEDMEFQITSKKTKKHRHRRRKRASCSIGSGKEESLEGEDVQVLDTLEKSNEAKTASCVDVDIDVKIEGAMVPLTEDKKPEEEKKDVNRDRHKVKKMDVKDKIVSPVIPQPGAWKRPLLRNQLLNRKKLNELPSFKPKNKNYQYGNYDRYYGYRNQHHEMDVRLQCFINHKELFLDKDILDIGCNVGHMTLCVARDLGARSAVGLDIDKKLINIARKNVKHYVNCGDTPAYSGGGFSVRKPVDSPMYYSPYCLESPSYTPSGSGMGSYYMNDSPSYQPSVASPSYQRIYPPVGSPLRSYALVDSPSYQSLESPGGQSRKSPHTTTTNNTADELQTSDTDKFFPISMPILFGPVDPPGVSTHTSARHHKFPHNVTFVQGNYVLESESLLLNETSQFDVILCLSLTKWLHLNWGDSGLKQAFRRMFLQLRPNGKLILEPQSWDSYKKRKKLTETIYKNYHSIEFMPNQFTQYLLSPEVGFTKVEVIGTPAHRTKGFQRPIQVFTKPEHTPSSGSKWTPSSSVRYTPYSQRKTVYAALSVPTNELDDSMSPDVRADDSQPPSPVVVVAEEPAISPRMTRSRTRDASLTPTRKSKRNANKNL